MWYHEDPEGGYFRNDMRPMVPSPLMRKSVCCRKDSPNLVFEIPPEDSNVDETLGIHDSRVVASPCLKLPAPLVDKVLGSNIAPW